VATDIAVGVRTTKCPANRPTTACRSFGGLLAFLSLSREYSPSVLKHICVNRLGGGWSRDLAAKVVDYESALARGPD
jgi:hypothetical protein